MEFYVIALCLASFLFGVLVATIIFYLCDSYEQEKYFYGSDDSTND